MQKFKDICLKIKDFYLAHKLPCTIGVSTLFLLLSTFWQPFIVVVLLYLLISMIFLNLTEILCINFYCLAFSGFLILFIGVSVITFILILVRFIIDLCKKRIKVYKLPLIITTAISVVFAAIFYEINSYGALQGVMIIAILYYFYIIFCYRKEINARQCSTYLIIGLIVSAIMGAFLYLIPAAQMFAFNDWDYGCMSIHDRMFLGSGKDKRLILLTFHINHLAVYCAFAISFVVYEYLKKDEKRTKLQNAIYCIGSVVAICVGILTLSKAFLVIFAIIILFTIVMSIVVYRKKSLKFLLPVLSVILIFCAIFWRQAYYVILRFFEYMDGGILNSITTGRFDIWLQYLNDTFSTVGKALFGVGLFTKEVVDIGTHNLYVMVLNRFGIIGTAALIVLIWSYIRATGSKLKYSFRSLFPMLIMLILFMQEACVDERLYFLLLGIMLAFGEEKSDDKLKNEEMANIENVIKDNSEETIDGSLNFNKQPKKASEKTKTVTKSNQELSETKPKKVYKNKTNVSKKIADDNQKV